MGQKYKRAGLVSIKMAVLAIKDKTNATAQFCGHTVKTKGLRLRTFAEDGVVCSACKLKANYFAVEDNSSGWHLNLWGVNAEGREILFTHDHTVARCLGGEDKRSNTTTMCSPCNNAKGRRENAELNERKGIKPKPKRAVSLSAHRAYHRELGARMKVEPMLHAVVVFRKLEAKKQSVIGV